MILLRSTRRSNTDWHDAMPKMPDGNYELMLVRSQNKSNSDSTVADAATRDSQHELATAQSFATRLFAVRNPNIFHLRGMLEKPAPFGQLRIEPVDGSAFVGPDLFQIADRHRFRSSSIRFVAE